MQESATLILYFKMCFFSTLILHKHFFVLFFAKIRKNQIENKTTKILLFRFSFFA